MDLAGTKSDRTTNPAGGRQHGKGSRRREPQCELWCTWRGAAALPVPADPPGVSDAAVLYVRTAADPAAVLGTVQQIVRSADRHIDVNDVRTIETLIGQSLFGASMGVGLLALFGVVALGLASLGLYGAMAFAVRQRRREIAVRIAVGARRHSVIGLVLRQGMAPVAAGVVVGGAGAAATGQLISGMLFGVMPIDPISFAIAAAVLVLAASAACLLPAHRASRVDPIAALREL